MLSLEDWPLLLGALGGVAGVMLFLRWYEPRMVFYPHVPTRRLERSPTEAGLRSEEILLALEGGTRVHGWLLLAAPGASPGAAGLTILMCHGNAGNISHRLEKCAVLTQLGADVLVFDYPGYGQSEGSPSEATTYAAADAAYGYLLGRGVRPERIVAYGESLGTGVAVDLASRRDVGGLILEAAFTSIPDVAQCIFWFLPVRFLVRNRYENRRKLGLVRAPILLLHSRGDRVFPLRHARQLLEAASEPKKLAELSGSHDGAFFESIETARREIRRFLEEVEQRARAGLG